MAVAVDPSEEVAGASQDMALALPSSHRAASPSASLGIGARRLDDDVLQQFDATPGEPLLLLLGKSSR